MLMAHPATLHGLLAQYDALREQEARRGRHEAAERLGDAALDDAALDDAACALCVATGTSDIDAAVVAARFQLPGTGVRDGSLRPGRADAGRADAGRERGRTPETEMTR